MREEIRDAGIQMAHNNALAGLQAKALLNIFFRISKNVLRAHFIAALICQCFGRNPERVFQRSFTAGDNRIISIANDYDTFLA